MKSRTYQNQSLNITKQLSLVGEDSKTTILRDVLIRPKVGPTPNTIAVLINADDVRISGFTITNAFTGIGGTGDRAQIIGNIIIDLDTNGIRASGSYQTITKNNVSNVFYGIQCSGSYNNITNNNIVTTLTQGIHLEGSFNIVKGNNLISNDGYGGIYVNGNSNKISGNTITHGAGGI